MGNEASIYRFGEIEVREREFSLTKAGEVLPVEPKAFRVRLILPRNPQMLITKTELLSAVWGDAADPENWTEPRIGNAISPRLENHIVLGSADEDALEQQGWEQTALVPPRQIHPDPHGRDERDVVQSALADPHFLGRQIGKALLRFGQVALSRPSALQQW